MSALFENLAEIIRSSSSNPLSLIALMVIAISIISFFFFRNASEKLRFAVFGLMFCGIAVFVFSILTGDPVQKMEGKPVGKKSPPKKNTIEVSATSPDGEIFINPYNFEATFEFTASADHPWQFTKDWPHGPGGVKEAHEEYKLPGAPKGSLIMRRGTGEYELIGEGAIVDLSPQEEVRFLMNDSKESKKYRDNSGMVIVEWRRVRDN